MTTPWQPYQEPLRTTLRRNIIIALVAGAVVTRWSDGWSRWPAATLIMLWPSFGGHWVELWYLNWLRPRISAARQVQIAARIATWFVGGVGLAAGMLLTARALGSFRQVPWMLLWIGGCAFICVELVAQLALQLRRRPSFYNGLG